MRTPAPQKLAADDDSGPRQFPDAQDLVLPRFADRGCRNGDDGEADALLRADAYLSTQPTQAESEKGQLRIPVIVIAESRDCDRGFR